MTVEVTVKCGDENSQSLVSCGFRDFRNDRVGMISGLSAFPDTRFYAKFVSRKTGVG
jgi:hypothetical protein